MNALILMTDILEKAILILLFGLSIWSISIILDRRKLFKSELDQNSFDSLEMLISSKSNKSELSQIFTDQYLGHRIFLNALSQSTDSETFERALSGQLKKERIQFEKGLSVLATLGANAPFIGLFGTVLGIIRAFAYLGSQSGSASVMSGVSQALYATAMGLLVAIPAVVANNFFANSFKVAVQKIESLRDLMIAKRLVEK